jgi:pyruvate kinase
MKTFNANLFIEENNYLQHCKNILNKISKLELDYLAIPYINKDLFEKIMAQLNLETRREKIIIKIEREITVDEINSLFQNPLLNMITIDLGELGVNIPFAKVGNYYKKIMGIKSKYKKNVLVMSQLLESVVNNYIPYRAEILNLTNMIKDGVNGLILCHETALGARPAYAINIVKRIIEETQHS